MKKFISIMSMVTKRKNIIFHWNNDLVLRGDIDTFFETDNGLEMDEEGYLEYYAMIVRITKVIRDSKILKDVNLCNSKEGILIELSELNQPTKVVLENGEVVWSTEQSMDSFVCFE